MNYKWIGAILVIGACGGFGFSMAHEALREERQLRRLIGIMNFMECEIQYHLTSLPALCRMSAGQVSGPLRDVFLKLAAELESCVSPDVEGCLRSVLNRDNKLSGKMRRLLTQMGKSLGKFDLPGQLKGIEASRNACKRELRDMEHNRDMRLRSYRTLGLCAGAALAVLLM